jgi:drug/metabolite transporter (DMT)-like permease
VSVRAPQGMAAPRTPAPMARSVDAALVLWMASLSALWGLNAISIRAVTIGMAPLLAAGLRGVVALLCLVPWGLWRGERLWFSGRLGLHSAVAGLIFATEFCVLYTGASLTTGGHVAIYINTAPFFVAVAAHYLLPGERMTWQRWAGLLLAFTGIAVLFSSDLRVQGSGLWRGDLLVIAGAALWGLTTVYIKRFMVQEMNGFELLYTQIAVSTPFLLAAAVLAPFGASASPTPLALGIVVFQGTVVVFFSYLVWMKLLRSYPASAVQSFTFLTPIWGVLLGALLLGETLRASTFLAIALVGLGLYLVNRPPHRA